MGRLAASFSSKRRGMVSGSLPLRLHRPFTSSMTCIQKDHLNGADHETSEIRVAEIVDLLGATKAKIYR